jgi:hypothetical protein
VRLRRHEEMKLQEVLEDEYETPREAATVVFNTVVDLLAQRKSFAVGVKFQVADTVTLIFGPFWEAGSANRFASRMAQMGLMAFRANVYRPVAGLEREYSPWCQDCGHPESVHNVPPSGKRGNCLREGCIPCKAQRRPRRTS